MRKAGILLCALLAVSAQPASAWDRMQRDDCQAALTSLATVMGDPDDRLIQMAQSVTATPMGWCRLQGRTQGTREAPFDILDWRMDGVARWSRDGVPPRAIEVRIDGLRPTGGARPPDAATPPPLEGHLVLRQDPEAGQIIIETARLQNAIGDQMAFTGVVERVFLSSASMMQVSMGSAVFRAGVWTMALTGEVVDPFSLNLNVGVDGGQDALTTGAFSVVSRLPEGVLDAASRAELAAFVGDLPTPEGTLDVIFNSERGLGLMQIGAALAASAYSNPAGDLDKNNAAILLDGVTFNIDWTPLAQVAD